MEINYVTLGKSSLPSVRHRMVIPGKYCGGAFISPVPCDADIHVFSKPFTQDEQAIKSMLALARTVPFVYDCWDNLFCRKGMDSIFVNEMIRLSVKVVTASEWLVKEIYDRTGRNAVLIQDPLEYPKREIKSLDVIKPFWFGTATNLNMLRTLNLPFKLKIISDITEYTHKILDKLKFEYEFEEWTPEGFRRALKEHNLLIIPGDNQPERLAKSANRVAEAINAGISVVAWPFPAYKQFDKYIILTENIEQAVLNPKQLTEEGQEYVTDTFDEDVIGQQWKELFEDVYIQLHGTANSRYKLA